MKISGLGDLAGVKGARNCVDYIELHAETPRALCLVGQILVCYHLAGLPVAVIRRGHRVPVIEGDGALVSEVDINKWQSLHDVDDLSALLSHARRRIADGTVGENWLPQFLKIVGADA